MFQIVNNRNNKNKSLQRNIKSSLINIKEECYTNIKTTMSTNQVNNTIYLSDSLKISQSKRKNLIKKNIIETKNLNYPKRKNFLEIKNAKANSCENKENNVKKIKTHTQTDFFNDTCFKTYLNKIPNISVIKRKSNFFNSNNNNDIIYYNPSIEDYYHKKKKECESPLKNKIRANSTLPESNRVTFINNILKLYKIKNKDSRLVKHNMKIKLKKTINETNISEDIDSKILKGFGLLSASKSALKVLFRKKPIKIKYKLNPIANSYGRILDDVSKKICFMKDSINLIYPKISQAKYLNSDVKKDSEENKRNRSLIEDYSINQNKIKSQDILYKLKKRKINQIVYSKYPISFQNRGNSQLTRKKYSLRHKIFL